MTLIFELPGQTFVLKLPSLDVFKLHYYVAAGTATVLRQTISQSVLSEFNYLKAN